jgi:FkbM family methyltransferase
MQPEILKTGVRAVVPRTVRNSLRSPSRLAEWLWDSAKFSLGATKLLEVLPGWCVRCHPEAYRVIYQAQVADPEQGREFVGFVSHCSHRMLLFDIGSHFGVFSLATAHFGGRAIAVDPSPAAVRMTGIQASINGLSSRVSSLRAAVSERTGTLEMLSSGVFSHGYLKVVRGRPRHELTRVRATTIDEMTSEFGAPTHVKIDVEGHEHAVLRGAKQTISASSPVLFLELHNEMVRAGRGDPAEILDELEQLGYATFAADGRRTARHAILSRPISRIVAKPASADYEPRSSEQH